MPVGEADARLGMGPIGGYFELELGVSEGIHPDGLCLNSGRNCFGYLLARGAVRHVYMPKYTCAVMLDTLTRMGISYSFYSLDRDLHIAGAVRVGVSERILYTNYFGVMDEYSDSLVGRYGDRLIIDASQALFFGPSAGTNIFYSPRKFVGVPDGGILYPHGAGEQELPADRSCDRFNHLIERIDAGAEHGYPTFRRNDASLVGQPVLRMSNLTRRLLGSIDFEAIRARRLENFEFVRSALGETNRLFLEGPTSGPMVYPYWSSDPTLGQRLIDHGIYVATYWPGVSERCGEGDIERDLVSHLVALPIDQRYGPEQMRRLVDVVRG